MRLFWVVFYLLCGVLWPSGLLATDAAQKVVRLAFVFPGAKEDGIGMKEQVFWDRLRALGWEEGRNLELDRRYAGGHMDRFPRLMEEVVKQRADIIVTTTTPGALAAKRATNTIPIVIHYMGDPVGTGLVSSLRQPGGNLTGNSSQLGESIPGKWLELLQEFAPKLSAVAVLSNPRNPFWRGPEKEISAAALSKGLKTIVLPVHDENEIAASLKRASQRAQAIVVLPDPLFIQHHDHIVVTVAQFRVPVIYGWPLFVRAGGLMSYSPDPAEAWEQAAIYVDKILRGARPGELPIVLPARYSLAVNVKTATALGLNVPESILLQADEVIR
jgi:putative ABC transport system substrate-binding protein